MSTFINQRIRIWQGLENFRTILTEILSHGVKNINQNTLDKIFATYNLKLQENRKDILIEQIKKQINVMDENSEERKLLEMQLNELIQLDEELIISKETRHFQYEFILKERDNLKNLSGFVKIISIDNPKHRGLLSWQQENRSPVIFLAELEPDLDNPGDDKIFFHINFNKDEGTTIIYEEKNKYMWTQIEANEYSSMIDAEKGSISMHKTSGEITLEDGNIAAAVALTKAETLNPEGVNIFTNNVKLMQMYKEDLQKLSFEY